MATTKKFSTQTNPIEMVLVKPEPTCQETVDEILPDPVELPVQEEPEVICIEDSRANSNINKKNHGIRIKNSINLPEKTLVNINGVLYLLEKIPDIPEEKKQTQKTVPKTCNKILDQPSHSSVESKESHKTFTSILDQPAPCPHCGKILKRRRNLKLHMQVCNNSSFYSCRACTYKTTNQTLFSLHLSSCRKRNLNPTSLNDKKGSFSSICLKCNVSMPLGTKVCDKCGSLNRWQCKSCNNDFKSYVEVKYHYKTICKPARYYHCQKCDYRSVFKSRTKLHIKKSHSELQSDSVSKYIKKKIVANGVEHICSQCGKKFDEANQLNRHRWMCKRWSQVDSENVENNDDSSQRESKSGFTPFIIHHCKKCDKNFELEEPHVTLQKSCYDCSSTLMFKCTKCDNLDQNYNTIVNHATGCSKEKRIKCEQCDFVTDSNGKLTEHEKKIHFDISATCTNCGSYFSNASYFERHIAYCGLSETFKCDKCPFITSSSLNLQNHIIAVHDKSKAPDLNNIINAGRSSFSRICPYIRTYCVKCNRRQQTGYRVKYCKICRNELQFRCVTCDKMYRIDDPEACEHVQAYLEQLSHECQRCGRGFIDKIQYQLHTDWCGKVRSYSCKLCNYSVKYKSYLQNHERQVHHIKDKPIKEPKVVPSKPRSKQMKMITAGICKRRTEADLKKKNIKNYSNFASYKDDSENKLNLQCKVVLTRLKI